MTSNPTGVVPLDNQLQKLKLLRPGHWMALALVANGALVMGGMALVANRLDRVIHVDASVEIPSSVRTSTEVRGHVSTGSLY